MKSTIKTADVRPYPKLMKSPTGSTVLMSGPGIGTVVNKGESCCEVGYWSNNWSGNMTDFTGSVTLEN